MGAFCGPRWVRVRGAECRRGRSPATAIRIADVGEASKFFFTLSAVVISGAGFAIVAFLSAVCALNYRTKMMPMRTSYLGWLAAAGFLVGNYGSASDANALGLIGFVSFLVWCIWILAVSTFLWRATPATSQRPAGTPSRRCCRRWRARLTGS